MKKGQLKRTLGVVATVAAVLVLQGCASGATSTSNTTPYTVVSISDVSGAQAAQVGISAYAAKAYFEMLNAKGGVNGRKVNLISLDTQTQVTGAVAAFQQAVSYNPVAILMGGSSAEFSPAAPTAIKAQIPILDSGGLPDSAVYPAQPFVYAGIPTAYQSSVAEAKFITIWAKEKGIAKPRVAIAANGSTYGADFIKTLKAQLDTLGATVVATEVTPLAATDFSASASTIAASHPDIVAGLQIANIMPIVLSELRADGVKVPFLNIFADSPDLFKKLADPEYYDFRGATFPTDPSLKDLQDWSAKAGVSQGLTSQLYTVAWIEGMIVTEALKKCPGSCTGQQLNSEIETVKLDLRPYGFGPLSLSSTHHAVTSSMAPFHWTSGGDIVVATEGAVDVSSLPQ